MRVDINAIQKVYRRYAQGYDVYFGALLQPGRKAIIEKMHCHPGDRILEPRVVHPNRGGFAEAAMKSRSGGNRTSQRHEERSQFFGESKEFLGRRPFPAQVRHGTQQNTCLTVETQSFPSFIAQAQSIRWLPLA